MRTLRNVLSGGLAAFAILLGCADVSWARAMAIYSLDDGTVTGSSVVDLSGNGYDGTTLSGVATGQPGKLLPVPVSA